MTRIEKQFINPQARVNPLIENQIRVLREGGNLQEVFDEDELDTLDRMGKEKYLAHLEKLISDDAPSEE